LSDKGLVEYKDSHGVTVGFECHEKLDALDYASFAGKAMNWMRYDTAVAFMREVLRLMPKATDESNKTEIEKMRSALVQLHNAHLTKREVIAGNLIGDKKKF
jgi:hypothetical protein